MKTYEDRIRYKEELFMQIQADKSPQSGTFYYLIT